jgi:hypothetical protein
MPLRCVPNLTIVTEDPVKRIPNHVWGGTQEKSPRESADHIPSLVGKGNTDSGAPNALSLSIRWVHGYRTIRGIGSYREG